MAKAQRLLTEAGWTRWLRNWKTATNMLDPSKGDEDADGGGRVKTDDRPAGAADEQATKFEQSI